MILHIKSVWTLLDTLKIERVKSQFANVDLSEISNKTKKLSD